MPENLKYITTCTLNRKDGTPCRQPFTDFAFDIPIIGEAPSTRAMKFVRALGKHTASKHQPEHEQIENLGIQFSGFLITKTYETNDPNLLAVQNTIRYHTHQMTRRVYVTDDHIRHVVADLGFTAEDGAPVVKAMQELRDILTETGSGGPQAQVNQQQENPVPA
jgi:hypothetical protein